LSILAEHNNTEDMMRFLQLLLGIAVQCEQKEKYIQGIMGLHESVQHTVMELIQELMNISSPSMVQMEDYKQLDEQYHHTLSELEALKLESDSLKQHNFDYQRKVFNHSQM
jgi:protein HOOK3